MAKRSTINPWGTGSSPKQPKPEEPPAPRNFQWERRFCEAIKLRVAVQLRYKDDMADRTFAPYAVYPSSQGKVCVSGTLIRNPADPSQNGKPHTFEVGHVRSLSLTEAPFIPAPWFDPGARQYGNNFICRL
jgi:hypothetical protein